MEINISRLSGDGFKLEVTETSTVENLKDLVCENAGVAPGHQKLVFRKTVLEDAKFLSEYGIEPGGTVLLLENPAEHKHLVYEDNSTYAGQIVDEKREGHGIWQSKTGRYDGQWKDDKQHGKGHQTWSDGRVYDGEFQNGQFSGQGRMVWHTPKGLLVYEGQYMYDFKHGVGKFSWADGRTYTGQWCNGKRHGRGVYVDANACRKLGQWVEDKFDQWVEGHAAEEFATRMEAQHEEVRLQLDEIRSVNTSVPAPVPPAAPASAGSASIGPNSAFDIELDKTRGETLGIDVAVCVATLVIEQIRPGLVSTWNDTCPPECKVQIGDRIIEVNGSKSDVEQLVDECKKNTVLKMKIRRL